MHKFKVGDLVRRVPNKILEVEWPNNEPRKVVGFMGTSTLKVEGVLLNCDRVYGHSFQCLELVQAVDEPIDPSEEFHLNKTTKPTWEEGMKSSTDYLQEAMDVQVERGKQYDATGSGERSFKATAEAFNAITGASLKGSDVCLILQCLKDIRQYSDPTRLHEDSLLDKVSYASLWAEELNKELK